MLDIENYLINNNDKFYDYIINIGFYDINNKIFTNYISKNKFYNILNKFKKFTKYEKNITLYKYLNSYKYVNNDNIIFYKDDFINHFIFKNNNDDKQKLNFAYLLCKENKKIIINSIEFPKLNKYDEVLNKKIIFLRNVYKDAIITINFEIITKEDSEEELYSINLNFSFDKNLTNIYTENLNYLLKVIYNNNDFKVINYK